MKNLKKLIVLNKFIVVSVIIYIDMISNKILKKLTVSTDLF